MARLSSRFPTTRTLSQVSYFTSYPTKALSQEMFTTTALLTALAAAATVSAHFTLDYPPTRGFDDDKEPEVSTILGSR
jgi:hypothetical protein